MLLSSEPDGIAASLRNYLENQTRLPACTCLNAVPRARGWEINGIWLKCR